MEVFGTGTAAVISPVNGIKYREHDIEVGIGVTLCVNPSSPSSYILPSSVAVTYLSLTLTKATTYSFCTVAKTYRR